MNAIGDEGFEILTGKNWPLLEDLNLKKTSITIKTVETLVKNRSSNWPNLKRLNVSHNAIKNEGLEIIVSSNWNQLESLYLGKTEITHQAVENIISKSDWPNLKELSLSGNQIGDEGVKTLCSGKWHLLEKLYLRETKITGKALESMVNISEWDQLKILDFSDNPRLFDEKIQILSEGKWPLLECLNLRSSNPTPADISELFPRCLEHWHSLKEVHFQGLSYREMMNLYVADLHLTMESPNTRLIIHKNSDDLSTSLSLFRGRTRKNFGKKKKSKRNEI